MIFSFEYFLFKEQLKNIYGAWKTSKMKKVSIAKKGVSATGLFKKLNFEFRSKGNLKIPKKIKIFQQNEDLIKVFYGRDT